MDVIWVSGEKGRREGKERRKGKRHVGKAGTIGAESVWQTVLADFFFLLIEWAELNACPFPGRAFQMAVSQPRLFLFFAFLHANEKMSCLPDSILISRMMLEVRMEKQDQRTYMIGCMEQPGSQTLSWEMNFSFFVIRCLWMSLSEQLALR